MPIHISPIVIPDLTSTNTEARVPKGTKVMLSDGGEAVYCLAASGVAQFNGVVISVDFVAEGLSTGAVADDSGIGKQIGWAQTSAASGQYVWIQTAGRPKGKLASACADRVALFTTATSGVLDDATISAALVAGVVSKTTISNATAVTLMVPTGAFIFPFVNPT